MKKTTAEEIQNQQQSLRDAVDAYENSLPLLLRIAESQAQETRAKYLALMRNGFTESQALQLSARPLV